MQENEQIQEQVKKKKGIFDKILDFLFVISVIYIIYNIFGYFYPYEANYINNRILGTDINTITTTNNSYYRDYNYKYVQNTKYLHPSNKQELLNSLYTFINSGEEKIIFYCTKEYKNCTKDAEELIYDDDKNVISVIYEFSHPYNDYKTISCGTDKKTNEVRFKVEKKYSKKKIKEIDAKVDELYNELYNPNENIITNIKTFHDYLVNNIEYDHTKSDFIEKKGESDSEYDSSTAYGALIQHMAICGGYTDAMYLFLDKMGVQSMRVTSPTHIWNAVYVDGEWLHLDLTWDDGRYTNGKTFLQHKYFLINSKNLLELDTDSHSFYQDVYLELSN